MTQAVVILSAIFLVWWLVGALANRRRAAELVKLVRADLPLLGEGATIRWFSSSAFQIDLGKPAGHLTRLQILGVLEARDVPLVWLYWRLRGRRDQLMIQADFKGPPRPEAIQAAQADQTLREASGAAAPEDAIRITLQAASPHLRLAARVQPGDESVVVRALRLTAQLAKETSRGSA